MPSPYYEEDASPFGEFLIGFRWNFEGVWIILTRILMVSDFDVQFH